MLLLLTLSGPQRVPRPLLRVEAFIARLARRRAFSIVCVIGLCLGGRLALWPIMKIPIPAVHDEFSHIFLGETLALGRLTNLPHPMWQHFETFHVLQQPTYQSMYPVGQGLFLAVGKRLFGYPWFGVWLSTGLMCGAILWMLYAWLPPRWALIGGLFTVLRFGLFSYWMNSYWGGSVAAMGGALLLGAMGRLSRRISIRDSLLFGLGMAVLANTRPYEGLCLTLGVLAALGVWLYRNKRRELVCHFPKLVAPILIVMLITGPAMAYYFWRVTGNPLQMPELFNRHIYGVAQNFLVVPAPLPPIYRHPVMADLYLKHEMPYYLSAFTIRGQLQQLFHKAMTIVFAFYLGPALCVPFLLGGWLMARSRHYRSLLLIPTLAFLFGLLLEVFTAPHHVAPVASLFILAVLLGLRRLRASPRGAVVAWGTLTLVIAMCGMRIVLDLSGSPKNIEYAESNLWCCAQKKMQDRQDVFTHLASLPGKHLVMVHYSPEHVVHQEWVYNEPDIDGAKITWAREMGKEKDSELMEYFQARYVWVVDADAEPPALHLVRPPKDPASKEKVDEHSGNTPFNGVPGNYAGQK